MEHPGGNSSIQESLSCCVSLGNRSTEDSSIRESLNCCVALASSTIEPYIPYSERPETYIAPVAFVIIVIIGVAGNGVLVLTLLRHANMRSVPNTYVLSLALGDLLVILTYVPFTFTIYVVDTWPFGLLLCKISECAKDVSVGVSVFTLTALSADRFFAIVDPMRRLHGAGGGRRPSRSTITVITLIWLLAIICAIPASFSYLKPLHIREDIIYEACYPFPENFGPDYPKMMVICRFVVYYALPLSVIAVFYLLMARHLFQSTRNMPGEMQGQVRQVRARKKVATMVMTFVVVFAVCSFPQHVYLLWFYINPTAQRDYNWFWNAFRVVAFALSFLNSCINPIALYCVSGTFRKYFNRYLLCCCVSEQRRESIQTSQRRGQSISITTSKRLPSCKHAQQSIQIPTWAAATMESRNASHQPDQETTMTTCNNGLEHRI